MIKRICALILSLCLLLTSASALTVEQARELLEGLYVDEVPAQVLEQPTIQEMVEALGDPYTVYYTAEEYAAFLATMEDVQLVGIGVSIYSTEKGAFIDQVAPDSPANDAGLRAGDYIVTVDGHDICGADITVVKDWLTGPEGTGVTLTVLRGETTFQVTTVRRQVVFPTTLLQKIENGVGWISCSAFGTTTAQHFYEIVSTYDGQVDKWVVDLRGNGGGDVNAAVFSAGCFVGLDAQICLRNGGGEYVYFQHDPRSAAALGYLSGDLSAFGADGAVTSDPVYVLTDAGTASAAEMFCVMIRDSGTGLIIGGRTYGKGIAQSMYTFAEGDALKITTMRGYSDEGATWDQVGILPHLLMNVNLADRAAAVLSASVSGGEDALYLYGLSSDSQTVNDLILPLRQLTDPANAGVVAAILSALPATVSCAVRENGELRCVTVEEVAELCGVTLEKRTFDDVADSTFAGEINSLGVFDIIHGMGDGTYCPGDALNRASMCALLVKALRCPWPKQEAVFADVPINAWYAPYVNALYDMGIVQGYDDGLFHPEASITHEEFLTILGRVAHWLDKDYADLLRGDTLPAPEELEAWYGSYSAWAREWVWLCDDALTWADPDEVDARAATTREEAAKAVYNLFQSSGVLPG